MRRSRYYDGPVSDHFDGRHFFGPDHAPAKTLGDMLRWQFNGQRARWPRHVANPVTAPPPARVTGAINVTMIGHASVLLQFGGLNILTDPVWSRRASPVSFMGPRRVRDPGVAFEDLPSIDLVLVTHNHYDHLDRATLKRLVKRDDPQIITPLGNDRIIRKGIPQARVIALDWDAKITVGDASITAEPVQHWSSRWLGDRNEALWAGFTVELAERRVLVTGDSGFGNGWWAHRLATKYPDFDLALLPLGAYAPRWFMRDSHMDPIEAYQAFKILRARHTLGYHWGTFQLTDEAMNEPRQLLQQALQGQTDDFRTLDPGESWRII